MIHDLKIWPEFYADVASGAKRYEIRLNDRDYKIGDELNLREWNPHWKQYSGNELWVRVVHITHGGALPAGAMRPDLCVMGIEILIK